MEGMLVLVILYVLQTILVFIFAAERDRYLT